MQVNPYLFFNGQCEEAFKFYAQTLGGTLDALMPHAGSPMEAEVPPEWRHKIMHAHLSLGEWAVMGSDCPPDQYEVPTGFSVSLQIPDPDEADRVFNAFAADGTVQMPLQETFWALRFGMVIDRFGTPWMINCDHPAQA